jgi:hypothetical protein
MKTRGCDAVSKAARTIGSVRLTSPARERRGRGGYGQRGSAGSIVKKQHHVDRWVTVPETATRRWVEHTEAREITLVKELGNLAP